MKVLTGKMLSNGFYWLPIHYTHDPTKATQEWEDAMKKSFPRPTDFDREFGIDFMLATGKPAYPRFSDLRHLVPDLILTYDERRPLYCGFDFNTDPMSLIVAQKQPKRLAFLKEFVHKGTIDEIVNEFRDFFGNHKADVVICGDATKGSTPQTSKSNWDMVRMSFRGFHITPTYRVPLANPNIGDRLNAVNALLQSDEFTIAIDPEYCPEFVLDLRQVVLDKVGKILKENDPDKPYYYRTHVSDAAGYLIFREYPTVLGVMQQLQQKRAPLVPGKLLGEVDFGEKQNAEREKQRAEIKLVPRKPLDRSGAW